MTADLLWCHTDERVLAILVLAHAMPQSHLTLPMQEETINPIVVHAMAHLPQLIEANHPHERMLRLHPIIRGVVVHALYFPNLLHVRAKIVNNL